MNIIEEVKSTELEAFTVQEVMRTIHSGEQEVSREFCGSLIKQGKALIGMGLHHALNIVFSEDKDGYDMFLMEHGMTPSGAMIHIKHFEAKKAFHEPNLLPNAPSSYALLSGSNMENKVKRYGRIKALLRDDMPSYDNIKFVDRLLNRGINNDAMVQTFVDLMVKQPSSVKTKFSSKSKKVGIQKIIDSMLKGDTEAEIFSILNGDINRDILWKTRVTSKKDWTKLSSIDKYNRVMYLEKKLLELTNGKGL